MLGFMYRGSGQGWMPDKEQPFSAGHTALDWDFGQLGLPLATPEVTSVDLTDLIPNVLSQGSTSTCVANAWEQALRMERRALGLPHADVLGSRLFGYSNSRAMHGMEKVDNGTFMRTYAAALKKVGNTVEADWPFRASRVNRTPPPRVYREAWAMRRLKGYYKIHDVAEGRTLAIRAALAARKPVVFGTLIDKDFKANNGPSIVGIPKGIPSGGHAMCCVGFKVDPESNEYIYRIVNSWGTDWRQKGFVWFTEEFMQWYALQDLWAVSLAG